MLLGEKLYKQNSLGIDFVIPQKFAVLTIPHSLFTYTDYNWFKADIFYENGTVERFNKHHMLFDFASWRMKPWTKPNNDGGKVIHKIFGRRIYSATSSLCGFWLCGYKKLEFSRLWSKISCKKCLRIGKKK